MGYDTYWSGSLALSRPLRKPDLAVLQDAGLADFKMVHVRWNPKRFVTGVSVFNYYIELAVGDTTIEAPFDSARWYTCIEDMQQLVSWLRALGIVVRGEWYWDGEEPYDFGCMYVRWGRVTEVQAEITYPQP